MKQRLCKDYGKYGQRAQVETSFSMLKRRLGAAVNARKYWSQCRELFLKVLTHNIMLLYAAAGFYRAAASPFSQLCGEEWRGGPCESPRP